MKVVVYCFASKNDSKHPHFCGICLSHLRQNGSSHIESVNMMINKTNDKAVTSILSLMYHIRPQMDSLIKRLTLT